MKIEKVHEQVLHKFQAIKGDILIGRDPIKGSLKSPRLKPDKYVSEEHILHDLVRGFYKPGGKQYLLSYLATESDDNYGKQIDWKDKSTFDFNTIIMHPPSAEKDVRKKSDIEAARNNMKYEIPIGILYRVKDRHNAVLGLGKIVEELSNGDFIIKPYQLEEWDSMDKKVDNLELGLEKNINASDLIISIHSYIASKGFSYSSKNIQNLYLSLRTKPFVIISGISGTGKTKIVQLFAEAIGAIEENGQFKLIPVRPDWSDSSELLGYTDIKGDFIRGPLTEMVEQAHQSPELPHFVLLDEMNLARVEYYFSDVLSVMESRKRVDEEITSSTLVTVEGKSLTLPGNLYVIGTVNMDETTHPFSKKVLDRANTIEFNEIELMNFDSMTKGEAMDPIRVSNKVLESSFIHLIDAFSTHEQLIRDVSEKLVAINKHLESIHAQVGYRVRDEISFYMAHNEEAGQLLSPNDAMDFCIMQKILPRVGGMEAVVRPVLKDLEKELSSYPRSTKKIKEMLGRLDTDGFTSFWIS